eukprot:m51a1_g2387 hypothetical protein (488) ;mRNA; r:716350-718988
MKSPSSLLRERSDRSTMGRSLDGLAVTMLADRPVQEVAFPETRALDEGMLFPMGARAPIVPLLRRHLARESRLTDGAAMRLVREARAILASEPNVLEIEAPAVVVGDLHGQFYDLLNLMDNAGPPTDEDNKYVFLGDYVDRGSFSVECVLLLCALKICHPRAVVLLRGNHESRLLGTTMTFRIECVRKYNIRLYGEFQLLFDALPLAALLKGTPGGTCFCVHGGISPSLTHVEQLKLVDRMAEIPHAGVVCDLVWSDPVEEWDRFGGLPLATWQETTFTRNSYRQASYLFGPKAVRRFLDDNNLCCIIRGHQVVADGFKQHFTATGSRVPPVMTVFSAPNYCGCYGNRAAFLHVSKQGYIVTNLNVTPAPYWLPNFLDVFSFSVPLITENVVRILQNLVIMLREEEKAGVTEEERRADAALAEKTKKLFIKSQKLREQQEEYRRVLTPTYHEKMHKFEEMLLMDRKNEAMPEDHGHGTHMRTLTSTM